jgi:phosphoribosylformylglycinamidine synthase
VTKADNPSETTLSAQELEWIEELLGRKPEALELLIFSTLWSETYSNKNSLVWLKKLPRYFSKNLGSSKFIPFRSGALVLRYLSTNEGGLLLGKRLALLGNNLINSIDIPVRSENCQYSSGKFEFVHITQDSPLEKSEVGDKLILVKSGGPDLSEALEKLMTLEITSGLHSTRDKGLLPALAHLANNHEGIEINLDNLKSSNSTKALLSAESEMILVIKANKADSAISLFNQYEINCQIIGSVTGKNLLKLVQNGKITASIPSALLFQEAPVYHREYQEPVHLKALQKLTFESLQLPGNYREVAEFLLQQPSINGGKHLLSEDNNASDALIIEHEDTLFALSLACNMRYVAANPEEGTAMLVSKAARQIVLSGGDLMGISHHLAFGPAEDPENYWMFVYSILGLKKSAERFNTPVLNGNVEFLSEAVSEPSIALVGLIDPKFRTTLDFKNPGDLIYLIGYSKEDLGSSAYLHEWLGLKESSAPYFNLNEEYNVQELLKGIIRNDLIESAHDISEGGLFNSLAECGISSGLGFKIHSDFRYRKDAWLFGEKQSRAIVTVRAEKESDFLKFVKGARNLLSREGNLGVEVIGTVTHADFVVDNEVFMSVEKARSLYAKALSGF